MLVKNHKLLLNLFSKVTLIRNFWSVKACTEDQTIQLEHDESREILQFPSVWLRDNCQCSQCFNQILYSRLIPCKNFQASHVPKYIACENGYSGNTILHVKWPDKHESKFDISWLRKHSFGEENQRHWLRNNYELTDKISWNSLKFKKILRFFSYEKVMNEDLELLKWLLTLNKYGIAIIQNIGKNESRLEKLTNRVGYSKRTSYGHVYTVEAKPDATNLAYLSTPLGLHVDLPYYEYMPSVNLLHFVTQSYKNGEGVNQLVDGYEISKQLKQYDEKMYKTLTSTLVEWTDKSSDGIDKFHHVNRAPVICENMSGQVVRINISQPQRDVHFSVSLQQANNWYKSMNWLIHLAHHPKNMIQLKVNEGDLLSFDNTRILHGRSGFSTERKVVGAYMDWDIIHSKIRVLFADLGFHNIDDVSKMINNN